NCLDVVVDSKARAILIWRDQDGLLPGAAKRLGVGVVKTMAECVSILTQVDGADESGSGIVTRVMRLLRLRGAAPAWAPSTPLARPVRPHGTASALNLSWRRSSRHFYSRWSPRRRAARFR